MATRSVLPVTVSPDLRITAQQPGPLTPGQALRFAEQLTLAAMMRRASLMPARQTRRVRSSGLTKVAL